MENTYLYVKHSVLWLFLCVQLLARHKMGWLWDNKVPSLIAKQIIYYGIYGGTILIDVYQLEKKRWKTFINIQLRTCDDACK